YLNHEWDKNWGGNIELYKNPRLDPSEDEIISVKPLFNRCVIFETNNKSWHGFSKIKLPEDKKHLSRKSFALYYYTNKREEKSLTHSTIYVERHLPERFKVGKTLSENDIIEIKTLLKRRDHHLKRVYSNVTRLMGKTAKYKYMILRFISRFKK
ncbi:MAG: 2OG-Fe(II) oxygenase, partial [Marinicellaceae bacterium]